jgi:O-antigen/teichoic acid export membrane protein
MLRVANFVAAVVIARVGGAATLGVYATALAYATVAGMIADNGLGITTVRRIGSSPNQLNKLYSQYAVSKTILFVPMIVVLGTIGWIAHLTALEWTIGALIVLRTILQSYCQMQITLLKAIDHMQAISPIQATHALILLAALWVCYVRLRNVSVVIAVLVVAQCLELLLETAWIRHLAVRLVRVHLRDCWRLLHGSTAVGVTMSLTTAIIRLDVIVLSLIAGAASAGVFAAAQAVLVIVYLLSTLLASVLFPEMARLAHAPDDLQHYLRHWSGIILGVTVPGTLLVAATGPSLMRALFGPGFRGSGNLLVIMLVAAPPMVLNALYLHRAFALHLVKSYLGIYIGATVVTLLLDSVLANSLGATGVAGAIVVREYLVLAAFWTLRNASPFRTPTTESSY